MEIIELNKKLKELQDELNKRNNVFTKIKEVQNLMHTYGVKSIDEFVEKYDSELIKLSCELSEVNSVVNEYQKGCSHNWKWRGYDGHKDFYKCPLCGAEKWE